MKLARPRPAPCPRPPVPGTTITRAFIAGGPFAGSRRVRSRRPVRRFGQTVRHDAPQQSQR